MKPILKKTDDVDMAEWIVSEFPESYQNMIFVDTKCGDLSVFLHKVRSKLDILNDQYDGLTNIYRAIRDEYRDFSRRVSNIKCTEDSFQKHTANQSKPFEDYMDKAINELALRKMSKLEAKTSFSNKEVDWKSVCKDLLYLSKTLKETFILNKDPLDVIQKFNHIESMIFHNIVLGQKDQHYSKTANAFKNFSGMAIISCQDHSIYKLHFSGWKLCKKMFMKKNKRHAHYLWKNF